MNPEAYAGGFSAHAELSAGRPPEPLCQGRRSFTCCLSYGADFQTERPEITTWSTTKRTTPNFVIDRLLIPNSILLANPC